MTNHTWRKDQILHLQWKEMTTYELGPTDTFDKEIYLQLWRDESDRRGFSFYLGYPGYPVEQVYLVDGIYYKPSEEKGIIKNLYLKNDDQALAMADKFLKASLFNCIEIGGCYIFQYSELLFAAIIDQGPDDSLLQRMPPTDEDSIYYAYHTKRRVISANEGSTAEPGSYEQMYAEIDRYRETKTVSFILKIYMKKARLENPDLAGASDETVIDFLDD